jgi:ketosteroid isomerase-like protein
MERETEVVKSIACALLTLFLPLSAAEPTMNHETALSTYVEKLNTHSWDQIAPCVAEDAVFLFTEDTFVGKAAAKAAFEKTFKLIENEVFSLHDIAWTVVTDEVATCHYEFRWKGLISGQESSGGGRGTTILRRVDGRWLIAHEHLGPYPRK